MMDLWTYVIIAPSVGSYTFTIGKAKFVAEKAHIQEVYKIPFVPCKCVNFNTGLRYVG